jgi:hypothetical protein
MAALISEVHHAIVAACRADGDAETVYGASIVVWHDINVLL